MSLEVRGLRAAYGRLEVLHGIDLDVADGELVAVIGANGAGKTTLLRTLSGLVRSSSGTAVLDGRDVTGLPAERLASVGLAHVPENRLVFPTLTVEDNLLLGAYARRPRGILPRGFLGRGFLGRTGTEHTADRDKALTLFPRLAERVTQVAGTMSGGEQQMLAIARGLMARPRLLVLDEPSLGLAPRLASEIFAALGTLRDEGLSLLLIEQNTRAAFAVADRAYVMDRGRVVAEGVPRELLVDPRVQAAFLGGGFSADPAPEAAATNAASPRDPSAAAPIDPR